eukprot:IDg6023t1
MSDVEQQCVPGRRCEDEGSNKLKDAKKTTYGERCMKSRRCPWQSRYTLVYEPHGRMKQEVDTDDLQYVGNPSLSVQEKGVEATCFLTFELSETIIQAKNLREHTHKRKNMAWAARESSVTAVGDNQEQSSGVGDSVEHVARQRLRRVR